MEQCQKFHHLGIRGPRKKAHLLERATNVSTVVWRRRSMSPQQQQTATAAESGFSCETVSPSMLPGGARLWGEKQGRVERSRPLWSGLVARGGASPARGRTGHGNTPGRPEGGPQQVRGGGCWGVLIGPRGGRFMWASL